MKRFTDNAKWILGVADVCEGWNLYNDGKGITPICYRAFGAKVTYPEAVKYCAEVHGAELVTVYSEQVDTHIRRLIRGTTFAQSWLSKSSATNNYWSFMRWMMEIGGFPCAVIGTNGKWFRKSCDSKNAVVCQRKKFGMLSLIGNYICKIS